MLSILFGSTALAGFAITVFGGAYGIAAALRGLARQNLFFTLVNEGEAKAIVVNQQFDHFVMAYKGHEFRRNIPNDIAADTPDPTDDWDILTHPRRGILHWTMANPLRWLVTLPVRLMVSMFRGLHWVGIPPFAAVYTHNFAWTSFTEVPQADGTLLRTPVPVQRAGADALDYILIQGDQYYTKVKEAECKDNIPLDVEFIHYGETVNPYKSLFKIEQWLEATNNMLAARMRDFVGSQTYVDLRETAVDSTGAPSAVDSKNAQSEIDEYFKDTVAMIEEKYGFRISKIKIINIGPGSELAGEFIRASTRIYTAEQAAQAKVATAKGDAEAITLVAEAEAKRAAGVYASVNAAGGSDMYKWDKIAISGLTTYVEGGGKKTVAAIPVGGNTSAAAPVGGTPPAGAPTQTT